MNASLKGICLSLTLLPMFSGADNAVTIYGQINVGLVSDKNYVTNGNFGGQLPRANDAPTQFKIDGQSSRIGFKGTESLGNGLNASFLLETGIAPDDAQSGRFGSREAWVSLGGTMGVVSLGRGKSLYTVAYEEIDQLYGNYSVAINGYGTSGSNRDDGYGDDGYAYRVNNALRYVYEPEGWKIGLEFAAGENKTAKDDARREFNGVVKYAAKGWWAQFAGDAVRNANGQDGSKLYNWLIGGGVDVGDAGSINLMFQRHTYDRTGYNNDRNSVQLAGYYGFANFSVYGGVIKHGKLNENGKSISQSDSLHYGLGVSYPLSKRTVIRVETGAIDFNTNAFIDQRSTMLAVFHSF
jgi:predicted porin